MKSRIYKIFSLFAVITCLFCNTAVFAAGWPTAGETIGSTDDGMNAIADTSAETSNIIGYDEHQTGVGDENGTRQDVSALINYDTTNDRYGDALAGEIYSQYSDVVPDVDTDDVIELFNRKGFEIIKMLQTLIQPFAIIIFMLAAIFVLVGSLGNSQLASKGLWGMIASCVCYAGVLYAPSILAFVVGWIAS